MKLFSFIKTINRAVQLLISNKEVTERYPDPIARPIMPKRFRGFLAVDVQKCTLCEICIKECPTSAIKINSSSSVLIIDYSKCFFCGYCVEVCPEKAMLFSKEFEGATKVKDSFLYKFNIYNR